MPHPVAIAEGRVLPGIRPAVLGTLSITSLLPRMLPTIHCVLTVSGHVYLDISRQRRSPWHIQDRERHPYHAPPHGRHSHRVQGVRRDREVDRGAAFEAQPVLDGVRLRVEHDRHQLAARRARRREVG